MSANDLEIHGVGTKLPLTGLAVLSEVIYPSQ